MPCISPSWKYKGWGAARGVITCSLINPVLKLRTMLPTKNTSTKISVASIQSTCRRILQGYIHAARGRGNAYPQIQSYAWKNRSEFTRSSWHAPCTLVVEYLLEWNLPLCRYQEVEHRQGRSRETMAPCQGNEEVRETCSCWNRLCRWSKSR